MSSSSRLPEDELTEEELKDLKEALEKEVWLDWNDLRRDYEK